MRLVNIENCNKELFYKQTGGKDNLITVEAAFNMLMALPVTSESEIYNKALEDFSQGLKDHVYKEQLKGKELYWTVAIDDVLAEMRKMKDIEKATREFKEKLESGYFSLGKEYDTTYDKELINIIESLNSEESGKDGARMKEYICKESLIKAMIESDMSVSPVSVVNNCTTVTKADILHEFEEWYAEHGDYSEVQLYEFKYKWRRWIEDFIAEKEQREIK